jgi:hypothetical protein
LQHLPLVGAVAVAVAGEFLLASSVLKRDRSLQIQFCYQRLKPWIEIRSSVSAGDCGTEPALERKRTGTPWKNFLTEHWDLLAAIDFFNVEVLTFTGIMRYHVLFAICLETREVQILGISDQLCESWIKQIARNLTDPVDGFLRRTLRPVTARPNQVRVFE